MLHTEMRSLLLKAASALTLLYGGAASAHVILYAQDFQSNGPLGSEWSSTSSETWGIQGTPADAFSAISGATIKQP